MIIRNDKENLIVKLSLEIALEIVAFSESLEENKKFVIAKQLLRSETPIGANISEAQNAENKLDFIHKIKLLQRKPMKQNIG